MDQRQASLLIRACDSLAAYVAADLRRAQEALTAFQPTLGEGAEAFSYFAASVADVATSSGTMNPGEFISMLPEQQIHVLPDLGFNWDAAVGVVRLVADGEPVEMIRARGASMDVPTAINSCFSVAVSAILVFSTLTNRQPTDWISILRDGAVRAA
jgi:hypothetical protein